MMMAEMLPQTNCQWVAFCCFHAVSFMANILLGKTDKVKANNIPELIINAGVTITLAIIKRSFPCQKKSKDQSDQAQ